MAKDKTTKQELRNLLSIAETKLKYAEMRCRELFLFAKVYGMLIDIIAEHYNPDDKDGFLKPFFDKLEEQQKQNKNQGEN